MTGIIANPNLDEKNQKAQRLRDLEDHFSFAIDAISFDSEEAEKEFKDDPFFAAMKLPDVDGTIANPTQEELDELRERQQEHERMMEDLDQG